MLKSLPGVMRQLQQSGLSYLWLTLLIFSADCLSKVWASKRLAKVITLKILPFLDFTLTYNSGAAFSFLDVASWWPNVLFTIITILVSVIIIWRLLHNPWYLYKANIALSLILGGALGNLSNRLYCHHVVDFIDCYVGYWHWPIFNLADSAIFLGTLMLGWAILHEDKICKL
jgi:signal peptidase II